MRPILILALAALTAAAVAVENEPPKLEPIPRPAIVSPMPKGSSAQQQEIETANAEYSATFKKGDSRTLAASYTEDADLADGAGIVLLSGRAAIEKHLKDYFEKNKGAGIELTIDSVRSIAPEVVLEKGSAVMTRADGNTEKTNYLAIHVKRGGKWLIAHLTEAAVSGAPSAYSHLQELEWLVGAWKDNSPEADVQTTCQWATNKTFLTRSFSAKLKDRAELEGTEVIGWDPIKGQIHAWIFDSEGGVSEAIWTREGERWLIQSVTTLPDGRRASSDQTITRLTDDKYTWEATNRFVDGELKPNIDKIEIDRVKAKD